MRSVVYWSLVDRFLLWRPWYLSRISSYRARKKPLQSSASHLWAEQLNCFLFRLISDVSPLYSFLFLSICWTVSVKETSFRGNQGLPHTSQLGTISYYYIQIWSSVYFFIDLDKEVVSRNTRALPARVPRVNTLTYNLCKLRKWTS